MELTFNNLTSSRNIICLSGVPNILTFSGSSTTNSYAEYQFQFTTIINIEINTTYNIIFGEYNITSTFNEENVGGTTFWLPQFNSYENQLYSCHTIVKAFRNVPFVAANFDVWLDDGNDGSMKPVVHIKAKRYGKNFNVAVSTDLPQSIYTWSRTVDGNTNDAMLQGRVNKVLCDLYKYKTPAPFGSNNLSEREYVTTLEKNYYGKPISFNVTPVLNTLLSDDNYEDMQQFDFDVYGFSDKKLTLAQQTSPMYITNGYLCNFSQPFINTVNGNFFAANVSRGDDREEYNNTYLYTYYPTLIFSIYSANQVDIYSLNIKYVNSANTVIQSVPTQVTRTDGTTLKTYTLQLDETLFRQSTYIDMTIPLVGTIRYNIVKPINAANEVEVRRVYWYNEYNGVSFFDFTGERTETRKENITTYEKQEFDFYNETNSREKEKVYEKKVGIEVKHTSHYIDKNGAYLFYSLQNAKRAWIELNGIRYYISVTNLEISETNNTSHIFTSKITYEFSRPDMA